MLRPDVVLTSTPGQGYKLCLLTLVLFLSIRSTGQPTCNIPHALNSTSVNDSTVSFNWSLLLIPNGAGATYDAEYREIPFGPWSKALFPYGNDHETALIPNAKRGTCYELRVRTICTSSNSTNDTTLWASITMSTGTTACPLPEPATHCMAPSIPVSKMRDDSTLVMNWAKVEGAGNYYEAEIRQLHAQDWNTVFFPYGNDSSFSIFNRAVRGNCYEWRVRTFCVNSTSTDTSSWTTAILHSGAAVCADEPSDPPVQQPYVYLDFTYTADPCFPGKINFKNNTKTSGISVKSIEWSLGDNYTSTANNHVHNYQKTGTYEVTLTVIDETGKSYKKTEVLNVNALSKKFANAGKDQTICYPDTLSLNASGGEMYKWSPCSGLSDCNIPNPKLTLGTNQKYTVTVWDKDGCIDRDTVAINFIPHAKDRHVPNAFTPNNDGINDLFRPLVSFQSLEAEWKLFNRFGNMIFYANNPQAGWDGTYKGQQQPPGNYSYTIKVHSSAGCPGKTLKGTVLLIR